MNSLYHSYLRETQQRRLHQDCGQDSDCGSPPELLVSSSARSCRPLRCCESRPDSMFGGSISMEMPAGPLRPSAAAKIDLLRGRAAPHPETVEERLRRTWSSRQYPERDPTNPAPASLETLLAENVTTPIFRLLRQFSSMGVSKQSAPIFLSYYQVNLISSTHLKGGWQKTQIVN